MAMNRTPIVGVFDEKARAEQAIEELYNSGIRSDNVIYSGAASSGGGFLESLKNLFTGADVNQNSSSVEKDLENRGLTQDEAQYYAQEYEAGRTIVAVQADEQINDALNILRSNGAYDVRSRSNFEKVDDYSTRSDYNQPSQEEAMTPTSPANQQSTYQQQSTFDQGLQQRETSTDPYQQHTNADLNPQQSYDSNSTTDPYQQQTPDQAEQNNYTNAETYRQSASEQNARQSYAHSDPYQQQPGNFNQTRGQMAQPGTQPDAYNRAYQQPQQPQQSQQSQMPGNGVNTNRVTEAPAGPGSGFNRNENPQFDRNPNARYSSNGTTFDQNTTTNRDAATGYNNPNNPNNPNTPYTPGEGGNRNPMPNTEATDSRPVLDKDIINDQNMTPREKEAMRQEQRDPYNDLDPYDDHKIDPNQGR